MQTRAARLVLFALLLIVGIGAAVAASTVQRRIRGLDTAERDVTNQIDRLVDRLTDIGAGQEAYVAPGQSTAAWTTRVADNLQHLNADTATLRPRTRSVEAAPRLQALVDGLGRLSRTDASIRDHVRAGQPLMASALIFGEAQQSIDAMTTSLRHLRDAESIAFLMEREDLEEQGWVVLGGTALMWAIGLLLLIRVPAAAAPPAPMPVAAASPMPLHDAMVSEAPATLPASLDLAAAAELCTALSRVTTEKALPDLLARTAAILDASGVIVWMGAGEELFAVTAHGYDPRVISRLGPIARGADNATAAAWRTGEMRTVAGDMMGNGAIVAPMFGPEACIGVLAAEVRHGREEDASTRAVTAMIAAQLATAVAAWPAASSPTTGTPQPKAV